MQIRPRDRALLVAVAAVAVLAACYLLAIAPEHRRAKQIEGQIATAKVALTSAQSAYASGRAAQARLASSAKQYRAAERAVPAVSNIPALLRLLQHSAAAVDVKIDSITPGDASAAGSSTSSPTSGTATPTAGTPTTSGAVTASAIPVMLTFGGGYEALSRLVRRLDTLVDDSGGHLHASGPLVGVSDVSLTPGDATGSAGSRTASLSISLTATIYQTASTASASTSPTEGSS